MGPVVKNLRQERYVKNKKQKTDALLPSEVFYIYIYIYVCVYTHTHTHTHTYIYIYIKMEKKAKGISGRQKQVYGEGKYVLRKW